MNTDKILKTDFLDILFQNKNKSYGAYELRKHYPNRLKKAMGIMVLLAFAFCLLQSWKTPKDCELVPLGDIIILDNLTPLDKPKDEIKPPLKHPKNEITRNEKQIANTTIEIVPDDKVRNVLPSTTELDNANIGLKNIDGRGISNIVGVVSGPSHEGVQNGNEDKIEVNIVPDEVIENPSVMPEFIGGIEALKRFMLKNLTQPDDIEEGQRIVVMVRFIVDKAGGISDVEIEQSGREDLDEEVKMVIQKMPLWKPGLQNGRPVKAFFRMPVSFINNN